MKKFAKFIGIAILGIAMASCSSELADVQNEAQNLNSRTGLATSDYCGDVYEVNLLAGQTIDAGDVIVYNTKDSVYVTYEVTGTWYLEETHLYVGTHAGVPKSGNGAPIPGQFPKQGTHAVGTKSVTYAYLKSSLPACFTVAAHASVKRPNGQGGTQQETGWAAGPRFTQKGNWATYTSYCVQECPNCVYELYTVPMYGGQTNYIGNLLLTNDAVYLYATYSMSGDWKLYESQVYAGAASSLPKNSQNIPVPGQFPYKTVHSANGVTSFTYAIPLNTLPGCYFIAAHGDVRKIVNGVEVQSETSWSFGVPFPNSPRWGWYTPYCTQVCLTSTSTSWGTK